MEREEFEEKVEEIEQLQAYFVVHMHSQVIYAEDYRIENDESGHEKLYLYCCTYLIVEMNLEDVDEVDYS